MTDQLLTTKHFIPPQGPKDLLRERLLAQIDEGLSPQNRLILVCAPAGYGKSTLASDWARRLEAAGRGPALAWLSLDEGDDDPGVFFAYFIASLQKALPGVGETARLLLQSPQAAPIQAVLSSLVNDLAQSGKALVLVLDDYHAIHSRSIHEGLAYFIDHLPPDVHLLIATRSDPPIPLHRYRGRGQLLEIRMEELRFTQAEVANFINGMSGFNLGEAEIGILEERTEGWITGIQMAALSLRGQPDKSQFIHSLAGGQRYILDYLVEEVMQGQTEAVQRFLLETSILDRMCAGLCDATTRPDAFSAGEEPAAENASEILAYLERANLFLIPLDEERGWYRYHHLFADLLRVRLKGAARSDPMRIPSLHRRAAGWLEANGWTGEAIQQTISAGDYDKAAGMVEQHTLGLFAQGELHRLLQWIRLLPSKLAASRPWLSVYQAWALVFAGQLTETEVALVQAEQAVAASSLPGEEERRLRGEMIAIRGLGALTSGNLQGALALRDLPADAIPTESLFARSVARWVVGYTWRLQGNLPRAVEAFEEVLEIGRRLNNVWTIVSASVDLGEVLRQTGRLDAAGAVYRAALQAVRRSGSPNPGFLGRVEAFLAGILLERNEVEEAHQLVLEAIEHNRRWENPNHSAHGQMMLARVCYARRDLAGMQSALEAADRVAAHAPILPTLKTLAEVLRARLWLAQGKTAEALRWAEAQGALPPRLDEESFTRAVGAARVYTACGNAKGALELLAPLEVDARNGGKNNALIEVLTLKALAAGDKADANSALSEALALGIPEGYRRVYLEEGEPLRRILESVRMQAHNRGAAAAHSAQVEHIDTLLEAFGVPAAAASKTGAAPPLTEREVEILGWMAQGLSNQEIGLRLYISAGTVKAHSAAIYRKLDVANRSEAISRAKDLGLI